MQGSHCRVALVVLLCALSLGSAKAQQILDLTGDPPKSDEGGIGCGGISSMTKHPVLPLEITIQDLFPVVTSKTMDRITVQFRLRNTGKEPIEIPSYPYWRVILRPGNPGQQRLWLALDVTPVGTGKTFRSYLAGSEGSSSVPGSIIVLAPGDSLIVRSAGQLFGSMNAGAPISTIGDAEVTVAVGQDLLADDGCTSRSYSKDVVSGNSVRVYWPIRIQEIAVKKPQ